MKILHEQVEQSSRQVGAQPHWRNGLMGNLVNTENSLLGNVTESVADMPVTHLTELKSFANGCFVLNTLVKTDHAELYCFRGRLPLLVVTVDFGDRCLTSSLILHWENTVKLCSRCILWKEFHTIATTAACVCDLRCVTLSFICQVLESDESLQWSWLISVVIFHLGSPRWWPSGWSFSPQPKQQNVFRRLRSVWLQID